MAFIAIVPMQLQPMWAVLSNGQFGLFWLGITLLPTIKDFPLWFYLTFAISSTMLPSQSDRHAWLPLGVTMAVLIALAVLAGVGLVDVDLPHPALELVSQHSRHHIWIKCGSAFRFDFAHQTHSYPAFKINRRGYPIKRCACFI